jgi:ATP-binding cassette subfamily C protein
MINSRNDRIAAVRARKANQVEFASAKLGRLLDPEISLPSGLIGGGRVGEIVSILADQLNFEQRPIQSDESKSELVQVAQALAGSGIRTRSVTLDKNWISRNTVNMVVQTARGLAVVVPGPLLRPSIVEVNADAREVNAESAAEIFPAALEVIRPLPLGSPRVWDFMLLAVLGLRRDITYAVLASLTVGIISLAIPLATSIIFSNVVPAGEIQRLGAIFVVLLLLASASGFLVYSRIYQFIRIFDSIDMTIFGAVLDRILQLPSSALRGWSSSRLAAKMYLSQQLQAAIGQALSVGLFSTLLVVLNGVLMLFLLPSLGAVAVILGLLFLGTSAFMINREKKDVHIERAAADQLEEVTLDLIRGWIPIRLSDGETSSFSRWASSFAQHREAFNGRWQSQMRTEILRVAFISATSLAFVFTAYSLPSGSISSANFLAFLSAFGQFAFGLAGLTVTFRAFTHAMVDITRIQPLLEMEPESGSRHEDPGVLTGAIELRGVGFRYSEEFPWVLRDVNFSVEPHQFVAIVGSSGSGKSTLLRLMLGFEKATSGIVAYEDTDISRLNIAALRRQFGVVLQSSLLIPGTIRENITITTGAVPDSLLWPLLKQVDLDIFVRSLPIGLDTIIDEGAHVLSGGQRQRLLLARAMAHSPAVLFLDEATSALDNVSQRAISERIGGLGMTRVVIAHRLSTIESADKIIVLDKGFIVQSGTYSELMSQKGLFADLVSRQEL